MEIDDRRPAGTPGQMATGLPSGPVHRASVVFDRLRPGLTIAFYPERPQLPAGVDGLWWRLSPTPEVIDDIIAMVSRGQVEVDAIAIGGLERYPLSLAEWPRWLAKWSAHPGPSTIAVDTTGLSRRQRRRLIARTERQMALAKRRDPVTMALHTFKHWITGRLQ